MEQPSESRFAEFGHFLFNYRADYRLMKPVALLFLLALQLMPTAQASAISDDIPVYAVSLVGSPYLFGGTTPRGGLDCSGFVGHVFKQVAGVTLPRDSLAISEATRPVGQAELRPGDLVFFNTLHRSFSHVGIFLGDDRFVHATSSRTGGVMISSLHEPYWHHRYEGARRVVQTDNRPPEETSF
jgi:cell wall-associated NlpC family hydrolase